MRRVEVKGVVLEGVTYVDNYIYIIYEVNNYI